VLGTIGVEGGAIVYALSGGGTTVNARVRHRILRVQPASPEPRANYPARISTILLSMVKPEAAECSADQTNALGMPLALRPLKTV
jgi:hypothetical protein